MKIIIELSQEEENSDIRSSLHTLAEKIDDDSIAGAFYGTTTTSWYIIKESYIKEIEDVERN